MEHARAVPDDPVTAGERSILRRALRALTFSVALLLLADLAAGHLVGDRVQVARKYLAPYDRLVFQRPLESELGRLRELVETGASEQIVTRFDAQLGWAFPVGRVGIDERGARESGLSLERARGRGRQVLAFGCSFTFGDEVQGYETWAAEVERNQPDCAIANFGVGGYGLDQALTVLEREMPRHSADEVWLALMPSAAPRAATHFRGLDHPWSRMPWLKPRMSVDPGGELVRHPNPAADAREVLAIVTEPGRYLQALEGDPFLGLHGGALAPRNSRLLHRSFTGRVFLTWRFFEGYTLERSLVDERLDLVGLHVAIALRAREVAAASDARLRYLILPSRRDLEQRDGLLDAPWARLVERLAGEGIEVLDVSEAVLSVPASERLMPHGHYSPRTNSAVGEWLAEQI